MQTYQGYIERLEHQAGPSFAPSVNGKDPLIFPHRENNVLISAFALLESPPEHLEGIFEEIEYEPSKAGPAFRQLSKNEAGWLARHIKQVCDMQRETIGDEITRELDVCYSFGFV